MNLCPPELEEKKIVFVTEFVLICFGNRKPMKGRRVGKPDSTKSEKKVVKNAARTAYKHLAISSEYSRKPWRVLNWRILKSKFSLLCEDGL